MMRIGIVGREGRMGAALAAEAPPGTIVGGVDRGQDVAALAKGCDVLIDFSAPDALEATLDAATGAGIAALVGTTGLAERHHWLIDRAAEHIAVLQTGNTALGVNLLAALVEQAAARLGEAWDIEIVETHHRLKADAPSGTALLLGEAAARGRGRTLGEIRRDAPGGARPTGTIGFAALRGGTVPGDHAVHFLGEHERLTLAHHAEDRRIFARGALAAAQWLMGQAPGRYMMRDVLGRDVLGGDVLGS